MGRGEQLIHEGPAVRELPEIFYQAGMGVWFWSFVLLSITPFFLIHWGVGLLAMAVETVLVMLDINRRKPLVAAHHRYE